MSDRDPHVIMRKMLQGFVDDPPDNDFQEGYLEALLVFAHDTLGIKDDVWRRAWTVAHEDGWPIETKRKPFMVIPGGLTE